MKSLATTLLLLIAFAAANAQSWTPSLSTNYAFTVPSRGMKQYIKYGNGLSLNLLAEAPSHRISAGLEFNWTATATAKHSKTILSPTALLPRWMFLLTITSQH
ncbi:MAG: hypothetical protein WDO15_04410 [Bacteroidota bacterium]